MAGEAGDDRHVEVQRLERVNRERPHQIRRATVVHPGQQVHRHMRVVREYVERIDAVGEHRDVAAVWQLGCQRRHRRGGVQGKRAILRQQLEQLAGDHQLRRPGAL